MIGFLRGRFGFFIIVLAFLLLMLGAQAGVFTVYKPGWEINAELVGSFIGLHEQDRSYYKFISRSTIEFDVDEPDYGQPNIRATVSDIRESTPKWPYAPLENEYGNFKYVTEYHEYLFDLQIRTVAGVKNVPGWTTRWLTETALPAEYIDLLGPIGDRIGKAFEGSILVRFVCSPWGFPDTAPPADNYTFNGYWLGVMNAKVEDYDNGTVVDLDQTYNGWVRDIQSVGGTLNMFQDDGTFSEDYIEVPWDKTKVLDPDIKSSVIVELPINLLAGAHTVSNPWYSLLPGAWSEVKPIDVWVTYTVRMECLVTKEYEFRDPGTPPNPSPIEPPQDWVPSNQPSWLDQWGVWLIIGAIAFVVLAIVLTWLGLPVLLLLSGILHIRVCRPYGDG
jgi:hypothetical protein